MVNPEERTMPPRITARQAFVYSMAKAHKFFCMGDKDGSASVVREALN